jgi:hypothetical protein
MIMPTLPEMTVSEVAAVAVVFHLLPTRDWLQLQTMMETAEVALEVEVVVSHPSRK